MTAVRLAIFGPSQESANRPIFGSELADSSRFSIGPGQPPEADCSPVRIALPDDVPTRGRPPSAAPLIASSIR